MPSKRAGTPSTRGATPSTPSTPVVPRTQTTSASTPSQQTSITSPTQPTGIRVKQPASQSSAPLNFSNLLDVYEQLWESYDKKTPQRTKLLDVFLAFLVVVGAIQFLYCIIAGNYPFNAFLAGFGATVGQFVLTVSLRLQTDADHQGEFQGMSQERAFADYVMGSLILHFFVINFVN